MKQHDNPDAPILGEDLILSVLGVYAPNDPAENAAFWRQIRSYYETNPGIRRPDFMGGDTNIVEDALDRLPSRPDSDSPVSAHDDLKTY
jgi:hypothetical protein